MEAQRLFVMVAEKFLVFFWDWDVFNQVKIEAVFLHNHSGIDELLHTVEKSQNANP